MKSLRWSWPILSIALAFLVPFACYAMRPSRVIELCVLDKTVPFRNWYEHGSLFWILRHVGVVKADGSSYQPERDYLGAYPPSTPGDPPERTRDLTSEDVARARLVYLADTYGVYREDLKSKQRMDAALERSPKIYGGLTLPEARAATEALDAGKTLVVEFDTLGSPTEVAARTVLETALGVQWTRWIGRYFVRLEDVSEVPQWMRNDYEREWGKPWRFSGPGYVLMQDDVHCEVLRVGYEVDSIGLTIERERPVDADLEGAADGVPYPYWFDVVVGTAESKRLASFAWHLKDAGRERLKARGLPERFPAVTRRTPSRGGAAWYFAGDFADNPVDQRPVPFVGYLGFRYLVEGLKLAPSETAFFWRFYVPMIESILNDAESSS
jgi:hypothetical protein